MLNLDDREIFGYNIDRLFRRLKISLKHWWQRRTRGWDDSDLWSLDYTLAKWIIPRLERFKEVRNGIPLIEGFEFAFEENATEEDFNKAEKEWVRIINKMIRAFTLIVGENDNFELLNDREWKEINEGLDLFRKYFTNLWW